MDLNLEAIDVDGAIRESAENVKDETRLGFLKKAGLAGGAFASGGAVLAALAPSAMAAGAPPASFGAGDIGILNYALTLEYLEHAFYTEALKNNVAPVGHLLHKYILTTAKDEANHVAFLSKALGSKAVKSPKFDFGKAVTDTATFAATAGVLENTGVHAYSGQAGNFKNPAFLLAALSIVTIEARHAGAIGLLMANGTIDVTGSFDTPYTAAVVLKAVKGTGFIVS
jgi:hypothetical protein